MVGTVQLDFSLNGKMVLSGVIFIFNYAEIEVFDAYLIQSSSFQLFTQDTFTY